MSALFDHTSCHGAFVSQNSADKDELHLCQKLAFERVAASLALPFTYLTVSEHELCALDNSMARIKSDTAEERRPILLIGGACLDEFVSLLSLEALAEGYDVHLLVDLSMSRIQQLTRVTEYRLFQAGAVPVSLRQLLLQWRAVTNQASLSATLTELIDNYDFDALQQRPIDDLRLIQNQRLKSEPDWKLV